jgi:pyridoxamine 5'-phosphate oxidase
MKNQVQGGSMAKQPCLRGNMLAPDPFSQFEKWFQDSLDRGIPAPEACCLATFDPVMGYPEGRMVLLKAFDNRGYVFFTNQNSAKGKALAAYPKAALTFYWESLHRQVRIMGDIEEVTPAESDAYFATRPRGSQLGAWVSRQSQPVKNRAVFEAKLKKYRLKYQGKPIPRPPQWKGYRVLPRKVEFWQERPNRLHDRFVYLLTPEGWKIQRLYP